MDLQINLNIDTEMVDKEYEIMYNEFQSENERIAFLRIGQSLIVKEDMDENFTFDYIKTYEENKNEFITKLDAKINAFSNTRDNILKNIDMIMSENKLILDNIKLFESKINDENNKNIFMQYLQINKSNKKEYLQSQLGKQCEIYNINFNKMAEMHEELLKLDYCIKSTNHYKTLL
jgi:hypothetical protein